jgi:hypothetical protein
VVAPEVARAAGVAIVPERGAAPASGTTHPVVEIEFANRWRYRQSDHRGVGEGPAKMILIPSGVQIWTRSSAIRMAGIYSCFVVGARNALTKH